jgi:ribosome biogenesis GTPase
VLALEAVGPHAQRDGGVPALSELDWKGLLGWSAAFDAAMAPYAEKGLSPARVSLVYRKNLRVLTESGERWARTGGSLLHRAESLEALPAVGDWVAARMPPGEGEALVQAVLPRRSTFVRKVPGNNSAPHVLACNVDTVLVVMGLDEDFNVRRLERFLTLAWESRAAPVVVLNKLDTCTEVEARLTETRAIAGDAPIHAVSARSGANLGALDALFGPGKTVALLGSSGVGKSTLVNRVLGGEVLATGPVRDDGKGRHTTSRRELIVLSGGGAVIDTPGLREVHLWEADKGLLRAFDDITALGATCRFGDCQHQAEPGCAVKEALARGELDALRFASWLELYAEIERLQRPDAERGRPDSKRRERLGHGNRRK